MGSPPGHPQLSKALRAPGSSAFSRRIPEALPVPWPAGFAAWITGSAVRERMCHSAGGAADRAELQTQDLWEGDPEVIWESHLEVTAHELCSWGGQMGAPVTQPKLKSL